MPADPIDGSDSMGVKASMGGCYPDRRLARHWVSDVSFASLCCELRFSSMETATSWYSDALRLPLQWCLLSAQGCNTGAGLGQGRCCPSTCSSPLGRGNATRYVLTLVPKQDSRCLCRSERNPLFPHHDLTLLPKQDSRHFTRGRIRLFFF